MVLKEKSEDFLFWISSSLVTKWQPSLLIPAPPPPTYRRVFGTRESLLLHLLVFLGFILVFIGIRIACYCCYELFLHERLRVTSWPNISNEVTQKAIEFLQKNDRKIPHSYPSLCSNNSSSLTSSWVAPHPPAAAFPAVAGSAAAYACLLHPHQQLLLLIFMMQVLFFAHSFGSCTCLYPWRRISVSRVIGGSTKLRCLYSWPCIRVMNSQANAAGQYFVFGSFSISFVSFSADTQNCGRPVKSMKSTECCSNSFSISPSFSSSSQVMPTLSICCFKLLLLLLLLHSESCCCSSCSSSCLGWRLWCMARCLAIRSHRLETLRGTFSLGFPPG